MLFHVANWLRILGFPVAGGRLARWELKRSTSRLAKATGKKRPCSTKIGQGQGRGRKLTAVADIRRRRQDRRIGIVASSEKSAP
jgi:hypothetical protein